MFVCLRNDGGLQVASTSFMYGSDGLLACPLLACEKPLTLCCFWRLFFVKVEHVLWIARTPHPLYVLTSCLPVACRAVSCPPRVPHFV